MSYANYKDEDVALLGVASAPPAEEYEITEAQPVPVYPAMRAESQVFLSSSSRSKAGAWMAECRNCHEESPRSELIAPCQCSGSIKWVHRSCLNEWRAVSPNASSFSQCDVCHSDYKMEFRSTGIDCSRCKFAFLISRDFLILLITLNAITTLFSVLFWLIDDHRARDEVYTYLGLNEPPHLFTDWLVGWLTLFFLLGIFGIFASIMKLFNCMCCSEPVKPTYDTYNYGWAGYYCYFCWVPYPIDYGDHYHGCCSSSCGNCDCHCGGCGNMNCSDGDVKGADGLIILLIVVVIIVILIGVIVGVLLIILFGLRVVQKHIHVLRARELAGQWEVVDLADDLENATIN